MFWHKFAAVKVWVYKSHGIKTMIMTPECSLAHFSAGDLPTAWRYFTPALTAESSLTDSNYISPDFLLYAILHNIQCSIRCTWRLCTVQIMNKNTKRIEWATFIFIQWVCRRRVPFTMLLLPFPQRQFIAWLLYESELGYILQHYTVERIQS